MKKTVESVTEGHPDKVCDQIADALLDEYLRRDTQARTAIEILGGHGVVFVGGEIATDAEIDVERVVRNVYHEIGYTDEVDVLVHVNHQSPDIAQGVVTGGAGDQGGGDALFEQARPVWPPADLADIVAADHARLDRKSVV